MEANFLFLHLFSHGGENILVNLPFLTMLHLEILKFKVPNLTSKPPLNFSKLLIGMGMGVSKFLDLKVEIA